MEVFSFLDNCRIDLGELFENYDNTTAVNLEQSFKHLKNAMDKQVRVWWDISTLEKYRDAKITPRRLRWCLGPHDGIVDEDLSRAWFTFFSSCENKLLDTIVERRRI